VNLDSGQLGLRKIIFTKSFFVKKNSQSLTFLAELSKLADVLWLLIILLSAIKS
jgi:hypothetical protein